MEEFPVLIIGAGPSGATTALLLGRLGIRSLVISRHVGTANTPRAHIFNQRAMEVLRDAGLEEELRNVASPPHEMMHTSWLHSLAGEEYGRIYAWGNKPSSKGDYEMASPCAMSDLPQSILEPILVKHAQKFGAEFRFNTEFLSQEQTLDGMVDTVVRSRRSGDEYKIRSQYLVGADGARSAVLDSLGITVDGKQLNTAFKVHIKADLLVSCRKLSHGSPWNEFVVSMHPANKNGKIFKPSEQDILARLHQMIGNEDIPIDILSTFRWTINDQVAREWQKGNVICIGDAAHRHPPINGLGSNTCISDAMNISWKLAYVLKGIPHPSILSSITPERKPVGDGIVRRANDGMEVHRHLWSLIGLTASEREEKTSLMSQPTCEGRELRRQFNAAIQNTEDELNTLDIQMNQIYTDSPITFRPQDEPKPPPTEDIDLLKQVVISTYPGYHLPHVWVARDGQSHRVSTLDLYGHGIFTIITGIGGDKWREWAKVVAGSRPGLQIRVISIGWRQDYMDAYGDWQNVRGVEDDGMVLVRPDHFVA